MTEIVIGLEVRQSSKRKATTTLCCSIKYAPWDQGDLRKEPDEAEEGIPNIGSPHELLLSGDSLARLSTLSPIHPVTWTSYLRS